MNKTFKVRLLRNVLEGAYVEIKAGSQELAEKIAQRPSNIQKYSDYMTGPEWDIILADDAEVFAEQDKKNQRERSNHFASVAVKAFEGVVGGDREDTLCDLLCDLMHWASVNNQDFNKELDRATNHFVEDVREDILAKPRRKK